MEKKTPNKRKSLATGNTTPTKIQKTAVTPVSQKKNKSPKSANKKQKTPQKKQLNGKQNTPKEKKKPQQTEEDETELMNESEENESDNSVEQEQEQNGNSDDSNAEAEDNANEDVESDEDVENEKKGKSIKKEAEDTDKSENDRKFSVYVGGLDYNATESDVQNIFDNTDILSVVLLKIAGTTKTKGSGFINFKNEASLKKALLKDGTPLKDRILKVKLPTKKDPADRSKKQKMLQQLKLQVQKLEKELGSGGRQKHKFGKPLNSTNKHNKKGKFNNKTTAVKQFVKQE